MKKYLLLLCISLGGYSTYAQLEEGQSMINLGLGLNSYYISGSGFSTTLPPLEGSYEMMISDDFSVGGFIGAYGAKYKLSGVSSGISYNSETKYTYTNVGALANYHFINSDTFNMYGGAKLGYVSSKVSSGASASSSGITATSSADVKGSGFLFGLAIGARYHLSDGMALNAELGYGIALLKVGVTFKM